MEREIIKRDLKERERGIWFKKERDDGGATGWRWKKEFSGKEEKRKEKKRKRKEF